MSDRFKPISMESLTNWVFDELEHADSVFGIPRALFFRPASSDPFSRTIYGQRMDTPFGVAAGPHSQMAQNIVVAWLCGARFIELKTVQTLDELEVAKPCIDMQDEGYNIEWSQELRVHESFEEYLRAWVLIHALHDKLGFAGSDPGTVFNVSVGYNLEGIKRDNVQWFLEHMRAAGDRLDQHQAIVAKRHPAAATLAIPREMSNSVTLSTMHGCPPDEVGAISAYLIEEWGFHTNVKLNPTLLGPDRLRHILNEDLGFREITVPDIAFEHDLKYPDAVDLLNDLRGRAKRRDVTFGVKLSNTLEVENHRRVFGADESMMYMSGRPLQAITVNLAHTLSEEFEGDLLMSYAGGANAMNVPSLLAANMSTVTTCSDLLKSGGYQRLVQYIDNTRAAMTAVGAESLDELVTRTAALPDWPASTTPAAAVPEDLALVAAARKNLGRYASAVLGARDLQRGSFQRQRTKTPRSLGFFDCIEAPCSDECAVTQKVPQYMRLVRDGRFDEAVAVTRSDNPLAVVLGRACDHHCELTCVRTHYDEPLAIREIKRFIMEHEGEPRATETGADERRKVAVIGAGPCGLSVGTFLPASRYAVTLFEARPYAGGMVAGTIPAYRSSQAAMDRDLRRLQAKGVAVEYGRSAGPDFTLADLRAQGFEDVVVAAGAQVGLTLGIDGEDLDGVLDGLEFLRRTRHDDAPALGRRVGVIGGGDVAMDCARSAARLTDGEAFVIYRRTIDQMPAQHEEIVDLLEEGIEIVELASPMAVLAEGGRVTALRCAKMKLGEPDASGRRRPVEIPGAEFDLPLDNLIVAIGQRAKLDFFGDDAVALNRKGYLDVDTTTMETSIADVYAGGDVAQQGPSSIVGALGDGKKIAAAIRARVEGYRPPTAAFQPPADRVELMGRRARLVDRHHIPHRPLDDRRSFEEVVSTMEEDAARAEAARCLDCDQMCSICTSVCPNLAFMTYESRPFAGPIPMLTERDGAFEVASAPFDVAQSLQVAVLTDFCNECGNCETFCPTASAPYREKPRLYLDREEFDEQTENAFMVHRNGEGWSMEAKFGGALHTLSFGADVAYSSPKVRAALSETFELRSAQPGPDCQSGEPVSLEPCAVMFVLLSSLRTSMPFLPSAP